MTSQFIGVGVGPGDPELMTLKAARIIEQADVVSFIANEQGYSLAKHIARNVLDKLTPKKEIPVVVNMFKGRGVANKAYDQAAHQIELAVKNGETVAFLCEGDPLFFGSFGYLLERLETTMNCEVVPGISSVHAASAALKKPLTMLRESFAVVSGRHDEDELEHVLNTHDSVVIMKAGRSRQTILNAITRAGRSHEASYLENISRDDQLIEHDINQLAADTGPYFSLFVVTRQERDRT